MPEPSVTFSWEVNIGQVFTAAIFLIGLYGGALRLYHLLDLRLTVLENTLNSHASTLTDHSAKMVHVENQMVALMRQVYRLIGRTYPLRDTDGDLE